MNVLKNKGNKKKWLSSVVMRALACFLCVNEESDAFALFFMMKKRG